MTREKAIEKLVKSGIFTEEACNTSEAGKFYVKYLMDNLDICDIDRYAWLNTLFQYDIGAKNAMEIDSWLWGSETVLKDYPLGFDTLELTWNDEEGKELLKKCNSELNLNLDFSNWVTYEPEYYKYYT
jgi:hypothetical protein